MRVLHTLLHLTVLWTTPHVQGTKYLYMFICIHNRCGVRYTRTCYYILCAAEECNSSTPRVYTVCSEQNITPLNAPRFLINVTINILDDFLHTSSRIYYFLVGTFSSDNVPLTPQHVLVRIRVFTHVRVSFCSKTFSRLLKVHFPFIFVARPLPYYTILNCKISNT
jgi:hypothetical protein